MSGLAPVRLTEYASGGGCGCKLAPDLLREILAGPAGFASLPATAYTDLLVGTETGDDAAVWRLDDTRALVATTDFFNPIVDDPHTFGRIAATNALSDVYAMGGRPILALALLGFPREKLSASVAAAIVAGGASACASAGLPVAGGHSIDCPEPIYGLAAIGLVHPDHVLTNHGARPGDALILTKALGIGLYGAALRKQQLDPAHYEAMVASTTQLNQFGASLAGDHHVHAMTDLTGFGLLGHALEMCAGVALDISRDAVPLLPGARSLAERGLKTGASARNWASYGALVRGADDLDRILLTDPQTSGGLLIAVDPAHAQSVLAAARDAALPYASLIGHFRAGSGVDILP